MENKVYIANIQKMCVHDGPGIRTTVFVKGCPLRCAWCQNPENLTAGPSVLFEAEKCAGCGKCTAVCPASGAVWKDGYTRLDRKKCTGCGNCGDVCLTGARKLCGKSMSAEELFREVMKDEVFFRNSGGGITLSGGEPMLYPEYVKEVFSKFQKAGIHTALETCGYCRSDFFTLVTRVTNLFLYDFKAYTSQVHRRWTGKDNSLIKNNLEALLKMEKQVIIRIPLIPGVNTGEEFARMMDYLQGLQGIRKIHLLAFHQMGASKYAMSGQDYSLEKKDECDEETLGKHVEIAGRYGFEVNAGGWDS